MNSAYFDAAPDILPFLHPFLRRPRRAFSLSVSHWDLLVLNREGCRALLAARCRCSCDTLLLPDAHAGAVMQLVDARQVVGVGMSGRSTLTCSSLQRGRSLICLQRTLSKPDGQTVEPQELLFPCPAPVSPEEQLLLCGSRLLLE